MPPKDRKTPGRSDETLAREAERKKRLAEALRENLRKRKAPKADGTASGAAAKDD